MTWVTRLCTLAATTAVLDLRDVHVADGLPAALTGASAPASPWNFTQVKAAATQSCA